MTTWMWFAETRSLSSEPPASQGGEGPIHYGVVSWEICPQQHVHCQTLHWALGSQPCLHSHRKARTWGELHPEKNGRMEDLLCAEAKPGGSGISVCNLEFSVDKLRQASLLLGPFHPHRLAGRLATCTFHLESLVWPLPPL